jgi:hypothetical protein
VQVLTEAQCRNRDPAMVAAACDEEADPSPVNGVARTFYFMTCMPAGQRAPRCTSGTFTGQASGPTGALTVSGGRTTQAPTLCLQRVPLGAPHNTVGTLEHEPCLPRLLPLPQPRGHSATIHTLARSTACDSSCCQCGAVLKASMHWQWATGLTFILNDTETVPCKLGSHVIAVLTVLLEKLAARLDVPLCVSHLAGVHVLGPGPAHQPPTSPPAAAPRRVQPGGERH